jgi:hypothetical protein
MAPAVGVEPTTCGLTVRCSTTELRRITIEASDDVAEALLVVQPDFASFH